MFADGREVIYTFQGRNAIALFCRLIGLGPNDEVLVPAFSCGAEIDPYVSAGATVVLYDVDRALGIDVDRISRAMTSRTRVLHVTHFFGAAQAVEHLAPECRRRGVRLLEDCAQALYSSGPRGPLGAAGDAAIYSFAKTLPVPDGGALVLEPGLAGPDVVLAPPHPAIVMRNCLPLVKRWAMNTASVVRMRRRKQPHRPGRRLGATAGGTGDRYPPMLASNRFVPRRANWAMSRVSGGILANASASDVVEGRRRNFSRLSERLADVPGVSPVIPRLAEGMCPLAFPFLVDNRLHWYSELEARGILVQGWPGYYPGFDWAAFPQACYLKDHLLTLPVHQDLAPEHIEYAADCVTEIARLSTPGSTC
jgi:perosamine synthetase